MKTDMPLVLGTAQLGRPYGIANRQGKPNADTGLQILETANECGCRWLDTAPSYGQSEEIIGTYFHRYPESSMRVITKIPSMANIHSEIQASEFIRESFQLSVLRIGKNRIKGLLLHDENDFGRFGGAIRQEFDQIQAEHALEYAGMSTYHPNHAAEIAGDSLYNAMQMPGNVFDQRYIKLVEEKQLPTSIVVFIRSIYLQGLFFADPDRISSRVPEALGLVDQFYALADQYGLSVQVACLGFVQNFLRSGDFVLIGAEDVGQVRQNFALWENCRLPEEFITHCRGYFAGLSEDVINPSKWKML